jgi:hypothetical protein
MQTLYSIEDHETGGIKTLLHVTSYTSIGLAVVIYTSDEYGTHKSTVRRTFLRTLEYAYHVSLRKKIKEQGGLIHKRISDTPLPKTKRIVSQYEGRDSKGRFIKKRK